MTTVAISTALSWIAMAALVVLIVFLIVHFIKRNRGRNDENRTYRNTSTRSNQESTGLTDQ